MPRDPAPRLGDHMACLNLFREADGSYHLTVSGHSDITPFIDMMNEDPTVENPMQALAVMIAEAGPRFVECWRHWSRG